eukprot:scaffold1199_cov265-Pinguiococcus_pyrenoidosus.AAC.2
MHTEKERDSSFAMLRTLLIAKGSLLHRSGGAGLLHWSTPELRLLLRRSKTQSASHAFHVLRGDV